MVNIIENTVSIQNIEIAYTFFFLILVAIIRTKSNLIFSKGFKAMFNTKKLGNIIKDENFSIFNIILLIMSISIMSITFGLYFGYGIESIKTLYIFSYLVGLHIFISLIIKIFAWTFNNNKLGKIATANLLLFNSIPGIIVSIPVMATFYVQDYAINTLIILSLIVLCIFYIIRFFRWIIILFTNRVSIFYMIVYLCTLEIVPLLTVYKLLLAKN